MAKAESVILFDGVCNLCNGSVQFIIKRDPKARFKYAALQSEAGQEILKELQLDTEEFRSIVLLHKGKLYKRSSAVLRIASKMAGLWPLFSVFLIVPAFIRNVFYDLIARNRYRWFGKQESCMLPTPELKARFL